MVWLMQGLIPLQVAHHLLEAWALAEAVGPKGYCAATSPTARDAPALSRARSAAEGPGLRQPAHIVQVPLPLLGQPALP